jgi:hypothetical protein
MSKLKSRHMQNKIIILILIAFFGFQVVSAQAEKAPASATPATEKATVPANMSDEALASYISGRLTPLLQDQGYKVSQACDASGCSVVVQ